MSDIKNSVRDTYNTIGVYFSRTRTKMWPEVQKWLDTIEKGEKILDAGCGNGRLLTGIKVPIQYVGIDHSEVLLEQAKKLHPKQTFIVGDLTDVETWSKLGVFDRIFCIAVFHHIATRQEQIEILREMSAHISKDGKIYLTMWNLWQPKYWKYHFSLLKWCNWHWLTVPFQKNHLRFCFAFDKRYLLQICNSANMYVEEIYYSDENGMKTNWINGQNLCAVVHNNSTVYTNKER